MSTPNIKKIEELIKTAGKRDKTFLERLYNMHFVIATANLNLINSAYKFKDELELKITRRDFSSVHLIEFKEKKC